MDNRPIGVFDSGLGGLTAVKKLREVMPEEDIIYFGDTGRVPYGTKGRDTILKYAAQDIRFLLSKKVKLIIAACGTVSSMMTGELAAAVPVPFITVLLPAAQKAAELSRTGRIGVLGTSATVRSQSYDKAIRRLRPDTAVIAKACPMFVPLVENGCAEHPAARMFAGEYLAEVMGQDVDTLILGCTHYPLLMDTIREFVGPDCPLIDPGEQTALYARDFLCRSGLCCAPDRGGSMEFYVSDLTDSFIPVAELFLQAKVAGKIEVVQIERMPSEPFASLETPAADIGEDRERTFIK